MKTIFAFLLLPFALSAQPVLRSGFTTNAPGADIDAAGSSITYATRLQANRDIIGGGVSLTNLNSRLAGYTNSLELILSNSAWNTAQSQLALSNAFRPALTWTANRLAAHDATNLVFESRLHLLETNAPATDGLATVAQLAATNTATLNIVTNLIADIPGGTATNAITTIVAAGSNVTVSVSASGNTNTYTVNTTAGAGASTNGLASWQAVTNLTAATSNAIVALIPAGGDTNGNYIAKTNGTGYGTTLVDGQIVSAQLFSAPGDVTLTPGEPGEYVFTNTQARVAAWGTGDITPPNNLTNPVQLAAGYKFSSALTAGGGVVSWGDNTYGQLVNYPTATNYIAVAAGRYSTFTLLDTGRMIVRGRRDSGLPLYVVDGLRSIAGAGVSAFSLDSLAAIATNGALRFFVQDVPGSTWYRWREADSPTAETNFTAVSWSGEHGLARRADHSLYAWGNNTYGQTSIPAAAAGTDIADVAAGVSFSAVRKLDGSVFVWGKGAVTNFPALTDVAQIAAGPSSVSAVRSNGVMVSWGASLTNATATNDVLAVALGYWHGLTINAHTNGQTLPLAVPDTVIGYHGTNYPGAQGVNRIYGTNRFYGPLLDGEGNPLVRGWVTNADGSGTLAVSSGIGLNIRSGTPAEFLDHLGALHVQSDLDDAGVFVSEQANALYALSRNGRALKLVQAGWTTPIPDGVPLLALYSQRGTNVTDTNASAMIELHDVNNIRPLVQTFNPDGSVHFQLNRDGSQTLDGTPIGGSQTPWTSDINAAAYTLAELGKVGIGTPTPTCPLDIDPGHDGGGATGSGVVGGSVGAFRCAARDSYGQSFVLQAPEAGYTGRIAQVIKGYGGSGAAMAICVNFVNGVPTKFYFGNQNNLTPVFSVDQNGGTVIGVAYASTNALPPSQGLLIGGALKPAGGIKTAEGDTFYPHTSGGNLIWTTTP